MFHEWVGEETSKPELKVRFEKADIKCRPHTQTQHPYLVHLSGIPFLATLTEYICDNPSSRSSHRNKIAENVVESNSKFTEIHTQISNIVIYFMKLKTSPKVSTFAQTFEAL